jgi:Fe-S cluster assembly ATPase SufC
LSFQNVPEIKGIRLSEYLRTIYNIALKNRKPDLLELTPFIFKRFIKPYLTELNIDEKFLERDLNV